MFEWLKKKFWSVFEWALSVMNDMERKSPFLLTQSSSHWSEDEDLSELISDSASHDQDNNRAVMLDNDVDVDFSSYEVGNQRFQSESYAKMYEMSSSRKWQWLRNLIYLKRWSKLTEDKSDDTKISKQFFNKDRERMLLDTDLSFVKNPLSLVSGDAYINQSAFEEYLNNLASCRSYHLFAQVLFCLLKKNSVGTLDLLKDLIHAQDQLNEQHFFDDAFTLLYINDKSQQWVGSLIYRILPKLPENILGFEWHGTFPSLHDGANILLCDDLSYTGTQVCDTLSLLLESNKKIKITLLFARMSTYALSTINKVIDSIKQRHPEFQVNIVVGKLFHTVSAQLDFLPFPPTKNERHIIKQVLESNFSSKYHPGDFQKRPLLTTGWKQPDFLSSYHTFLGTDLGRADVKKGPDILNISSKLLTKPPREPITLFSQDNAPPDLQLSQGFIDGPIPPYKMMR